MAKFSGSYSKEDVDNCFELLSVARMITHQFDVVIEMSTQVFQIFDKVSLSVNANTNDVCEFIHPSTNFIGHYH